MRFYNTMSKQKEEFVPLREGKAGIYVCGPTVYNYIHVGNARPQVVFDALRRYMTYKGYDVTFVQNFTDVDDKIIKRANEEGVPAIEVANRFIEAALKEYDALNILKADANPRVTEEMTGIIGMIEELIEKGFAYEINGQVFFNTAKSPDYGKLSGKKIEELEAGARVEVDNEKLNPSDFVLWKPAKAGEPFWASPWGDGRPGWHIECSVMAKRYLGSTFDIHCGGSELAFPHHENEIAQSEAANGTPFARYWLHNAMICVDGVKMSKSLNNFFLLKDVAKAFSYDTVRFFILSAHYRSPLNFSEALMQSAQNAFDRIINCGKELKYVMENGAALTEDEERRLTELPRFKEMFEASMDDDLNTANAITAIFELVKFANMNLRDSGGRQVSAAFAAKLYGALTELTDILGIKLEPEKAADVDEPLILSLIEKRRIAREKKDFAESDRIRDELLGMGVEIKDTRDGVKWSMK